jgi:hypothetical protein
MLTVDHQPSMSAHVGGMHLKASVWEPAQQSLQPVDVEDDQEETIYDAYDEKGPLEPAQSYFDDDEDEDEEDVSESSSLDWRCEPFLPSAATLPHAVAMLGLKAII